MNVVFIMIRAVVVDHEDHIFDVQTASGDGGGDLKNNQLKNILRRI